MQTYDFENRLGNDVERLPNDEFLGIFKPTTKTNISFGGSGGVHRRVNADSKPFGSMPLIQVQNSPITIGAIAKWQYDDYCLGKIPTQQAKALEPKQRGQFTLRNLSKLTQTPTKLYGNGTVLINSYKI